MIYGNAMNNIWRNARHLNNLVTQIETGKKTQRPSCDPLLAARSLRYRTILAESEQFLRNVQQGMAWMEVSEAAFNSILTGNPSEPSSMQRIRTHLVEGATGTNELADQLAILAEMRQYFDQMFSVDMNQTYLGRYVFSGFHTNQPPVLKNDWNERSFIISQDFKHSDIERTFAFYRASVTDMVEKIPVNVIKLPFTNVEFDIGEVNLNGLNPADLPTLGITLPDGTDLNIVTTVSTAANAYRPVDLDDGQHVIHYLSDTGELVMSDAVRDLINRAGGLNVTYEKNNLKAGELNPIVYFPSVEITGGETVRFDTAGQGIQMEISPNTYITINSHARDILTANLYSDLRRLFDFADSLVLSDPKAIEGYFRDIHGYTEEKLATSVSEFLADEKARFAAAMHDRMNNMLKAIDQHSAQAQRQHTNLGSRMSRLEMVWIRLEEDEVSFTDLLSQNEDADFSATIMRKDAAEANFNNALMAIAKTTQLSLADFINR
jgi:flagellar hook-associated protein 3 FlgL